MQVSHVMTRCPYTIDASSSIDDCLTKMKLQKVRHMPVGDDQGFVGVVTERELQLIQFCCTSEVDIPLVGDLASSEPTIVKEQDSLFDVAQTMADNKLDYVLVTDEDESHIVGIFTTTDACRAINLLQDKLAP
jgi:CBS domain-containing protein